MLCIQADLELFKAQSKVEVFDSGGVKCFGRVRHRHLPPTSTSSVFIIPAHEPGHLSAPVAALAVCVCQRV